MSNIITMLNLLNDAIFVSLVNTTLQMTLLIPLIALIIWMFRIKSAATRYSLWLFVIFGIIALPLLTPFIPQIGFAQFHSQRATGDGPDDLMRLRMGGGVGESSEGGDSVSSMTATKTAVNKEVDVSLFNPVSVAYFLWCAVALFMFCITLDAYRKLRRLKKSSPYVTEHEALEMLFRLKDKLKVRGTVALKASSEVYTPVSLGIFSPTIILPDSVKTSEVFEDFGSLEMILTHELAHIKRCDYLINFLQNMLKAIFFFHPLFHFVSRNLTSEREHICDDWVVDMTKQRGRYAECIIGLLEKTLYKPLNPSVTIAMAERKRDIPRRIEMIMDKKRKITAKVSQKAIIAMFLIGFLALPVIGGIELVRLSGARPASNEGWIVFATRVQIQTSIRVVNADGENERQLTNIGFSPAWSPDGKQIAYYAPGGIWVMNADGSNANKLPYEGGADGDAAWSPDGKRIAFGREIWERKDGKWQLKGGDVYVMDADGSNLKNLTESPRLFRKPDWSPDGSKIAIEERDFLENRAPQVWVMDADGSNQKMLNNWGEAPAWSPDGNKIAFSSKRDGWAAWNSSDIYVMDADGSNVKILTTPGPSDKRVPEWSPDGTKIAFCSDPSNRDENWDIYIMDADGSNIQQLTNDGNLDWWGGFDWIASSYGVGSVGKLRTTWGQIKCALGSKAND